jgi:hypothetical protein
MHRMPSPEGDLEISGGKGEPYHYGEEEESYTFQQTVLNGIEQFNKRIKGEGASPLFGFMSIDLSAEEGVSGVSGVSGTSSLRRKKFSPVVRCILKVLRTGYALYMKSKTFLTQVVSKNWGYSALFFFLLFVFMLYPLFDLLWYLVIRATIALCITLFVSVAHKRCVKLLERKTQPLLP